MKLARTRLVLIGALMACLLMVSLVRSGEVTGSDELGITGKIPVPNPLSSSTSRGVDVRMRVSESIISGSEIMQVNNSRLEPSFINNSINITVGTGLCVERLDVVATSTSAITQYHLGEPDYSTGSFTTIDPDNVPAQAGSFNVSYFLNVTGAWVVTQNEQGSGLLGPSWSVYEVRNSTGGAYLPSLTNYIARNVTNHTTDLRSEGWEYYSFNLTGILSPWLTNETYTPYWLVVNGTQLYDGGAAALEDKIKWRRQNENNGPSGWVANWNGAVWSYISTKDYPFVIEGQRTDSVGGTWQANSAENAGLDMRFQGYTTPFSSDTSTIVGECLTDENGRLELTFVGNVSVSLSFDWAATVTVVGNGDGEAEPREEELEPTGRRPDHLDHRPWEPGPYVPSFIEATGWYWFGVGVLLVLTIAVWRVGKQINKTYKVKYVDKIAGYGGLIAIVVYGAFVMAFPRYLDPLVGLAEFLFGWGEWRNWPSWLKVW